MPGRVGIFALNGANQALEQSRLELQAKQATLEAQQRALGEKVAELRVQASVIERARFGITYADPPRPMILGRPVWAILS